MVWEHFSYNQFFFSFFSVLQPLLFFFQISPLLSVSLFYFIIFSRLTVQRASKDSPQAWIFQMQFSASFLWIFHLRGAPMQMFQPRERIESKHNQSLVCLRTSVQLNMNQAFDWVTLERQAVKNKHSKQIKWEADVELNLRRVMKQTEETNRQ